MRKYLYAGLSWIAILSSIFILDAIIRRLDPKFYEPRSDYTGSATDGLFEHSGNIAEYVLLIMCVVSVLPTVIILWKKNRLHALGLAIILFILSLIALPWVLLLYACATGVACI